MKKLLVIPVIFLSLIGYAQLSISGNPEALSGATWTYVGNEDGVEYDLQGILLKPQGQGPFPAVIISHGTGGNVNSYSKVVAQKMVSWGYVCIATNYTHAGGVASCGSPGADGCCDPKVCGSKSEWGASESNIQRGKKCLDILSSLSYVEINCVMAFGHSRGAFLSIALVASYPSKFSAAGHTAGGVTTQTGTNMPTSTLASNILCPYIIHHGEDDSTVFIQSDSLLYNVFKNSEIQQEFHAYPETNHSEMAHDLLMYQRTRDWFEEHACISPTNIPSAYEETSFRIFPNPSFSELKIELGEATDKVEVECFNAINEKLFVKEFHDVSSIELMYNFTPGTYYLKIDYNNKVKVEKVIIQ